MILPTMTYKEIYDHLAEDVRKVEIREEYLRPKAIKSFKRKMKFPAWELYEYTIPATNNRYVIYFYAETRLRADNPEVGSFAIIYNGDQRYIIQAFVGAYKHTPDSKMIAIRQIHAYTSHFFQRYRERFLKDGSLTANEVAVRYLSRNTFAMPLLQNDEINRNYEKYGENGKYAFRVRDGVCFSYSLVDGRMSDDGDRHKDKVEVLYLCYTTFMNESGMTNVQREAIVKEHYAQWLQFSEDLYKNSQNGIISLKLES